MLPDSSPVRRVVERVWLHRRLPSKAAAAATPPNIWRRTLYCAALDEMDGHDQMGRTYVPTSDDRFVWACQRLDQIAGLGPKPDTNLHYRCKIALEGFEVSGRDRASGEPPTLAQGS